jgi:hypothetical protein
MRRRCRESNSIETECDRSWSRSPLITFPKYKPSECVTSCGTCIHTLAKRWLCFACRKDGFERWAWDCRKLILAESSGCKGRKMDW